MHPPQSTGGDQSLWPSCQPLPPFLHIDICHSAPLSVSLPIYLCACCLSPLQALSVPKLVLAGRLTAQNDATVGLDGSLGNLSELATWPEFHNGVAAGLKLARVPPGTVTRAWVVYNRPVEASSAHGGLLMALGLRGHLRVLAPTDFFRDLALEHEATTVGVLLGAAASYRATMDANICKMLYLHIPSRHPPSFPDLELPPSIQICSTAAPLLVLFLLHPPLAACSMHLSPLAPCHGADGSAGGRGAAAHGVGAPPHHRDLACEPRLLALLPSRGTSKDLPWPCPKLTSRHLLSLPFHLPTLLHASACSSFPSMWTMGWTRADGSSTLHLSLLLPPSTLSLLVHFPLSPPSLAFHPVHPHAHLPRPLTAFFPFSLSPPCQDEIGRKPEGEGSMEREGYSLGAGLALGLVTLGTLLSWGDLGMRCICCFNSRIVSQTLAGFYACLNHLAHIYSCLLTFAHLFGFLRPRTCALAPAPSHLRPRTCALQHASNTHGWTHTGTAGRAWGLWDLRMEDRLQRYFSPALDPSVCPSSSLPSAPRCSLPLLIRLLTPFSPHSLRPHLFFTFPIAFPPALLSYSLLPLSLTTSSPPSPSSLGLPSSPQQQGLQGAAGQAEWSWGGGGAAGGKPGGMGQWPGASASSSGHVLEGNTPNVDVTAPGAILALAMMYLQSNNEAVAARLAPPSTHFALEFVRPDFILLRVLAHSLILWDSVRPSEEWVAAQVPGIIRAAVAATGGRGEGGSEGEDEEGRGVRKRGGKGGGEGEADVDEEAMALALCNLLAGCCLALGLRYAGSANGEAENLLRRYALLFFFLRERRPLTAVACPFAVPLLHWRALLDARTLDTAVNAAVLSLSLVMAGTGHLPSLRLLRFFHRRTAAAADAAAVNAATTYGSHMAVCCMAVCCMAVCCIRH
ncbi:unnamed protein product [Closterium sp. NIES-53]